MNINKLKFPSFLIAIVLTLIAIYMAFVYAPPHDTMGDVQRIFYFHVASAWIAYLAFAVTFVTGLIYLKTKDMKWDKYAFGSAELGVVFCTIAITTGPLWGKAVWGVYWRLEDIKLFMTLVLWLIFIAYLALRANVQSRNQKANLSAVFGIIGFVSIPLSFAANRIWEQSHPTVIATSKGSLQASMGISLAVATVAFTFLYIYLLLTKVENENIRETIEFIKQEIGD
ncbi:MAG: cytochrome c biogenesis protein [Candidatus Thermoplasmatota archaeon]|jgi:heme exporter protein C|nr:cytochrome c biogenesis protein [Candidatus Thermoplasmatota archaeon]MDP7265270.1 cytochrome c biogenesis protein [Candidatus Thermoplasmatota archaeon]